MWILAGPFTEVDGQTITVSREEFERDADELLAVDLPKIAAIVPKAAEKTIPAHPDCPYDPRDVRCFTPKAD
jgi:hypothetical protein